MPIHEYRCEKCGKEFEELVFGEEAVACPECGSTKTEKLMSCCRHTYPGGVNGPRNARPPQASSSSGCAGCSGGNCSTCK
ncbi:MAG: zinc ribbon domain-containing protein [Desulfovibrionaceae bacterium]|jgi:putative FmdB family regulatory protein|nr:zinc ribbon domain-containing protein [Desulfovibrionaceae bacterium]